MVGQEPISEAGMIETMLRPALIQALNLASGVAGDLVNRRNLRSSNVERLVLW